MNNHDLLDAVGELSEETVHKYALPDSRNTERAKDEKHMDTTVTQPITQTKKKPFRISMGAAAAAIALCVGLNAAILFGMHKMKQDAVGMSSGTQVSEKTHDKPYLTITDVTPTFLTAALSNPTEEEFTYNPEFAISADGKLIPTQYDEMNWKIHDESLEHSRRYVLMLNYEQLSSGTYQLVNLNADGSVNEGVEPVEFEISEDYFDRMFFLPELSDMALKSAAAILEKTDLVVTILDVNDKPVDPAKCRGTVKWIEETHNGHKAYHNYGHGYDQGYWVEHGAPCTLYVYVSPDQSSYADEVPMPSLIGMDYGEALKMYGDMFQIVVDSSEFSEYEADQIFFQDIQPGDPVGKGEPVHVKVSLGAQKVLLPDVTDWEFETAKQTIFGLGLYVDKRMSYSSEVEKGKVISTEPEGPCEMVLGSYVRMTVSLGKNPDTVPVPNFVNMDWDMAKTVADSLNLELMKKEVDDAAEKGTVLNQNVQPGDEVSEHSLIELTVSSGQKQEAVRISFNVPAGAAGKYHIGLYEGGVAKAVGGQFDPEYAAGVTSLMIEGIDTAEMVAVLYNDENGKEATIGTYRLDFDKKSYETLSEDIAGAFKAVQ